jgi:hypothetical protein
MSHTVIVIQDSLLDIFDPNLPEYAGVRDHFTTEQLSIIDEFRSRPVPSSFTFQEKLFISWALDKAVMTAENP